MAVSTTLILTRHGEARCNVARINCCSPSRCPLAGCLGRIMGCVRVRWSWRPAAGRGRTEFLDGGDHLLGCHHQGGWVEYRPRERGRQMVLIAASCRA
jgi:hypothetical protein